MGKESVLGAAGTIAGGAGSLLNAVMSWYAMDAQIAENRRVEKIQMATQKRQEKQQQRQFDITTGFNLRQQRFNEDQAKLSREERANDRLYSRATDVTNRLAGMMSASSQYRDRILNLRR